MGNWNGNRRDGGGKMRWEDGWEGGDGRGEMGLDGTGWKQ